MRYLVKVLVEVFAVAVLCLQGSRCAQGGDATGSATAAGSATSVATNCARCGTTEGSATLEQGSPTGQHCPASPSPHRSWFAPYNPFSVWAGTRWAPFEYVPSVHHWWSQMSVPWGGGGEGPEDVGGVSWNPWTYLPSISKLNPTGYATKFVELYNSMEISKWSRQQMITSIVNKLVDYGKNNIPEFVNAYPIEVHDWKKYLCAGEGKVSNLKTFEYKGANVATEDNVELVYVPIEFNQFRIKFDRFFLKFWFSSRYLPLLKPFHGSIEVNYPTNRFVFVLRIPSMMDVALNYKNNKCIVYVDNFIAEKLEMDLDQCKIETTPHMCSRIKDTLCNNIKLEECNCKTSLEAATISLLNSMLPESDALVCKKANFEEELIKRGVKPVEIHFKKRFKKHCGDC